MNPAEKFIREFDARRMPRYHLAEAARYLGMPVSTLHTWFFGSEPLLDAADRRCQLLSFYDVASAHVLLAFRRKGIGLSTLRYSLGKLKAAHGEHRYPLLAEDFYLFGKDIVVKEYGQRLNLTRGNQLAIIRVVDRYLARIERDERTKMPLRFSPLRSATRDNGPAWIVIDPTLSGGRPVVKGSGIMAEVIAGRRKGGESVGSLASDYGLTKRAIEEAIRYCEKPAA